MGCSMHDACCMFKSIRFIHNLYYSYCDAIVSYIVSYVLWIFSTDVLIMAGDQA